MIRLISFLGNPGPEYARNRHNAGRLLAEASPFFSCLDWRKKYKGRYAAAAGERVLAALPHEWPASPALPDKFHFLIPETYMNLSGESIFAAAAFLKIKPEEILLVHDELEIPPGAVSLKFSGGLGGHNGLRSMKARFGSADFWRLRIGIGRPDGRRPGEGGPVGSGRGIADWVLSDFSAPEMEELAPVLEAGADLLLRVMAGDPETFLPEWKKKKIAN
ncbi:MAG: aminoacyl-tRNA hydrolase [Treponema sp.]|jgi:PTH1 family peptidyl-tRNA hydrolase|nr:aminoacyl-tRNA hydrolase [Treponema sp.]